MNTPKPTSPLASVRTFAKDLEKKRASRGGTTELVKGSNISAAKTVLPTKSEPIEDPANHRYQAPTWTGNKIKPTAAKLEPTPAAEPASAAVLKLEESTAEKIKPAPTLKPLTTPKPVGDTTIIVENEDSATATIIRDTKKNRFRLFPAIFRSIRFWFSEQNEQRKIKNLPKYTVPEASLRKGVIQKATSQTGKITSFDHISIQERIRQRQERTAPKMPGITWSANTEPGFPLLEAPAPVIQNIEVVPKKSFRTPKAKPVSLPPAPAAAPAPVIKLPLPPVFIENPIKQTPVTPTLTERPPVEIPKISTPEVKEPVTLTPAILPTLPTQVEVTTIKTTPALKPALVPQTTTLTRQGWREWLFTINTNTMAMVVVSLVFLTVVFGVTSFFWLTQSDNLNVTLSIDHPILLNAPLQLVPASILQRQAIFALITQNYQESPYDILQLLLVTDASGQTLISTPRVVEALNLKLDTALTQAITHIYFGGIKKTDPFLLFKITDTNTAKGGMLTWEETLYEDLTPLLASNPTEAEELSKTAVFVDDIIDGTDVRILRTLAGRELLIYGIINRNTVIITANRAAFMSLAALKL